LTPERLVVGARRGCQTSLFQRGPPDFGVFVPAHGPAIPSRPGSGDAGRFAWTMAGGACGFVEYEIPTGSLTAAGAPLVKTASAIPSPLITAAFWRPPSLSFAEAKTCIGGMTLAGPPNNASRPGDMGARPSISGRCGHEKSTGKNAYPADRKRRCRRSFGRLAHRRSPDLANDLSRRSSFSNTPGRMGSGGLQIDVFPPIGPTRPSAQFDLDNGRVYFTAEDAAGETVTSASWHHSAAADECEDGFHEKPADLRPWRLSSPSTRTEKTCFKRRRRPAMDFGGRGETPLRAGNAVDRSSM